MTRHRYRSQTDVLDYSPVGKKDFKYDQVIHALKETKRFLEVSEGSSDLMGVMELNRVCSRLLKMMNDALDIMLKRKRDNLLQATVGATGPIKPKYSPEKTDKIKQHEIDTNKKLIEALSSELERLSDARAIVSNPGCIPLY